MTLSFVPGFDPEALSKLEAYFSQPATRLSLGIPADAPAELQPIGRRADREILHLMVGARELVVEIVPEDHSSKAAARMAHEFSVLEALEAFRVAPAPLMIDLSGRRAQFPLMVREYVVGPRLTSPNDLVLAMEALSSLHAIPSVQGDGLPVVTSPLESSLERSTPFVEQYLASPLADPESCTLLENVRHQLADRRSGDEALLAAAPRVITHGQATINKVVATDEHVRLLQLDGAALDHPSVDLCRLLSPLYFALRGQLLDEDAQRAALEAYQRSLPIKLESSNLLDLVKLRFPYVLLEEVSEAAAAWVVEKTGESSDDLAVWPDLWLDDCLSPEYLRDLFEPYLAV